MIEPLLGGHKTILGFDLVFGRSIVQPHAFISGGKRADEKAGEQTKAQQNASHRVSAIRAAAAAQEATALGKQTLYYTPAKKNGATGGWKLDQFWRIKVSWPTCVIPSVGQQ